MAQKYSFSFPFFSLASRYRISEYILNIDLSALIVDVQLIYIYIYIYMTNQIIEILSILNQTRLAVPNALT
jgi:hypothetical protein